ncbi:MAG TPA: glycosyltransferase family 39 protein [Longimicrobium sp.]|nr:glycosyltransferase family 39 protein [Longimicrobium sp.]
MNLAGPPPKAAAEPQAPPDRLPRSRSELRAEPAAEPRAGRARAVVAGALLVGVLLRLMQYAVNRSLWLDEGLLVSNFLDRPWAALLQPFDRGQTAPVGFLALVKGLATVLGRGELVLRLAPLLAGLATLALLPRAARRFVTRPALPFAVAIVALAPYLVYYSSEVKQYAFDALLSLLVLWLAHDLARRPHDRRTALAFAAVGVVGAWFSQPVIFMLAGAGTVLGLRALRRRDRAALATLALQGAAWLASFAAAYLVSRHQLEDPQYMREFWRAGFLPLTPGTTHEWTWLPRMLARAFREPMGVMGKDDSWVSTLGQAGAVIAFLAGAAWMARHRRLRLALLLAPAGFALTASALHVYPFGSEYLAGGRVLVFLLPSLALVTAEGIAALPRLVPASPGRLLKLAAAALVLLPSAVYAAVSVPHLRAEVKPLLEYVNENRQPGDVMYVFYNGQSVFEYYAPRYGWSSANAISGVCARYQPQGYVDDLARLRGRPRVWLLFVEGTSVWGFDEKKMMMDFLDHVGRRLDDRVAVGASVYLYDLREANSKPGPFRYEVPPIHLDPALGCRGAWEQLSQLK